MVYFFQPYIAAKALYISHENDPEIGPVPAGTCACRHQHPMLDRNCIAYRKLAHSQRACPQDLAFLISLAEGFLFKGPGAWNHVEHGR